MVAAVLIGIVAVALGLWAAVSPRSLWWLTQSWQYRDAEANEPSDAAYLLTRIGGLTGAVILIVVAVMIATS